MDRERTILFIYTRRVCKIMLFYCSELSQKTGFFKEQNASFSAQIDSDKTWLKKRNVLRTKKCIKCSTRTHLKKCTSFSAFSLKLFVVLVRVKKFQFLAATRRHLKIDILEYILVKNTENQVSPSVFIEITFCYLIFFFYFAYKSQDQTPKTHLRYRNDKKGKKTRQVFFPAPPPHR